MFLRHRLLRPAAHLTVSAAVLLVAALCARPALAVQIIQIRTGQSGGVPGSCPSPDDSFRCIHATVCGQPLRSSPFTAADFAAASTGPPAVVISPAGPWTPLLSADPQARWINWQQIPGCTGGTPQSTLYACKFTVTEPCTPVGSIQACWLVDDLLGDPSPGANPIGVYINGVPLNSTFAGGNYAQQRCAQQAGIPLVVGDNWLYVYQRDAGCAVSGLNFTATITVTSSMCPSISVYKYNDLNGNGAQDPGEPGLPNWQINISGPSNQSMLTDANGNAFFHCVPPGSYQITETPQPGWIQTFPAGGVNLLNVSCGQDYVAYFGNRQCDQGQCVALPSCVSSWFPFDECGGGVANEVVANRDGVLTGGSTWGPGLGSPCSIRFVGGGTTSVVCPNYPEHNFGTGSFSVIAWVRTTNADAQVHTILDKRDTPFTSPTGYALFLYNGLFRFQWNDGVGTYTTYVSTAPAVNDGGWHMVAVSVCRDPANPASNVAKLYVDHHVDTFTGASIPTGSLTCTNGLTIGDQCPGFLPGVPFDGYVDNVQLYKCCLTDAQISSLVTDYGYCKQSCHVPSMLGTFGSTVTTTLQICNYALTPQNFTWTIAPLPSGTGCSVAGPTVFSPYSGTVTVPAATGGPSCVTVPVTITLPPMGYFQTACYQVTVQNMSSNLCCVTRGRIRRMHWWHVLGDPVLVSAPKDMQVPVHFTIQNSGDAPVVLNYRLDGVLEDGGGSSQVISLNGLPPGEPVFGQLSIPPQSEGSVDVATLLLQLQPMTVDEVVLSADVDGDGTPERLASVGLVSVAEQGTSDAPIPPAGESGALGASLHASPNPFAHQTTIRFSVPSSESAVRVEVFDVAGRSVRRVLNGPVSAGMHNVVWDGLDEQGHAVNAGIYFVRVRSEGGSLMTRVVRLQ